MNTTFRDALPSVLQEATSSPLFAFLDPFCPSDLPLEDFQPLLYRQYPTELCIVLHTPGIRRMIRAVQTGNQGKQALRSSIATLEKVFGGTRWHRLIEMSAFNPWDVAVCYRDELMSRSGAMRFYHVIHPIEAHFGVNLKYHILFRTRHKEGVTLMNDAFCKEAHQVYAQSTSSDQVSFDWSEEVEIVGRPVAQGKTRRIAFLAEELESVAREHPARTWVRRELSFEIQMRRFGEFSTTEHRQAIEHLIQQGRLNPITHFRKASTGKWITSDKTELRFSQP